MGAWIETPQWMGADYLTEVAPYVGAWIETSMSTNDPVQAASHPTWVRGLKHKSKFIGGSDATSHPTWVRGLKQIR